MTKSTQGCWTCRVRRKKCSGEQPICGSCTILEVPCYGFGAKPDWLDGGEKEKERLQEIKSCVKRTTESQRRPRALNALRLARERKALEVKDPQDVVAVMQDGPGTLGLESLEVGGEKGAVKTGVTDSQCGSFMKCPFSSLKSHDLQHPWKDNPELEPMLLMHYLDVVYPLQFPFYKPRVEDGGRNWVLALLMRCRPLYNGALSLAAYHQSTVLVPNETGWLPAFPNPPFVGLSDVQEEYYTLVLGGLREHVAFLSKLGRREGLRDSIYILACVTQLILLEVARGGTENWQRHLAAAPILFPFLRTYQPCHPNEPYIPNDPIIPCEWNPATSAWDISLSSAVYSSSAPEISHGDNRNPQLSYAEKAAMEMNSGIIIWVDILGAASTGRRPSYGDVCRNALGASSRLQMHTIMGVRNWVMVIIRDIAVLADWKTQTITDGTFDAAKFAARGAVIDVALTEGLNEHPLPSPPSSSSSSSSLSSSPDSEAETETVIHVLTLAFFHAARVYLFVLLHGPHPSFPLIEASVAATLAVLQKCPRLVRYASWAVCIAGSMAGSDAREGWRVLTRKAVEKEEGVVGGKRGWGSIGKAVEVVERVWERRDGGWAGDWTGGMEGGKVLLI